MAGRGQCAAQAPARLPALLLALALLLAGCATPQAEALRAGGLAGVPRAHDIAGVPYYPQEQDQCGPATLAMALTASGLQRDPVALRDSVFLPGRAGTLAPEMLAATRRQGRLAVTVPGRLEAVLREVAADHPVIVLQNLGLSFFPVWHYALLVGYDLDTQSLWLRSGPQPRARMGLDLFERTWARGGYWAMLALAPGDLPVTRDGADLVDAIAALERVDAPAARQAYTALTRRAPREFGAWLGAGNTAYGAGDWTGAVNAFQTACALQPESADCWNNLASALLDSGAPAPAQAAVARALAIGGPHQQTYEETQRQIRASAGH